jgi:5-methylcytosine-specific restriction endonuclease McrA
VIEQLELGTDIWASRSLAAVDHQLETHESRMIAAIVNPYTGPVEETVARFNDERYANLRKQERLRAGGLTDRPPRNMPSMKKIVAYHGLPTPPTCVRCGLDGYLERAHIIDRVFDGLDLESNLLPLCPLCHRSQPIFKPGDEDAALKWFSGEHYASDLAALLNAEDPHRSGGQPEPDHSRRLDHSHG